MTESDTALYDEETLSFDVPDAALELAGSKCWEGPAASATRSHFVRDWIAVPACALGRGRRSPAPITSGGKRVGMR